LNADVTYLYNSGFLVRIGDLALVFDDWKDPANVVQKALAGADALKASPIGGGAERSEAEGARTAVSFYFFASHNHYDHFDPHIFRYADTGAQCILSRDIWRSQRTKCEIPAAVLDSDRLHWVHTYDAWADDRIEVQTFSSTDAGVSFLVTDKQTGLRVFHAGDFNWWDWEEAEPAQRAVMEQEFRKQLARMEGLTADLAFFPVDGRLGATRAKGAYAFVRTVQVGALVTMHSPGFPRWEVPDGFRPEGQTFPIWSPLEPGEKQSFSF